MIARGTRRAPGCTGIRRRTFLADAGMGFTGLALGSLLHSQGISKAAESAGDGVEWRAPTGQPHFQPKAKNVIWLFMVGGASQVETFDPKPELNRYAGKTIAETPYAAALDSPYLKKNLREFVAGLHKVHPGVFPMQVGWRPRGQSGIGVSDWFPHVGDCIDDIAVIRSMWTTDNDHGGQLQFHTGRHALEGFFPSIGAWINYGLGTLNENLPQFVVMGQPLADCCGGMEAHGADYLGPQYAGVQLKADPHDPLPFASPGSDVFAEEQRREFELLGKLNTLAAVEYPADPAMQARIKSYELAFRMQAAIPELFRFETETAATQQLYGLDQPVTADFGRQCLAARRMVERGVRFVQIYHGSSGGAGSWDAHGGLKAGHSALCAQTDRPIAGLLKDLKRSGLLEETIVVWATEFGRTPGAQGGDGRDHHPYGFTVWMAGGGIKRGVVHGATDELGFHAVEHRHYVTDIHATLFRQLGLDPRRLEIPGHKRLEIDYGEPIWDILA